MATIPTLGGNVLGVVGAFNMVLLLNIFRSVLWLSKKSPKKYCDHLLKNGSIYYLTMLIVQLLHMVLY